MMDKQIKILIVDDYDDNRLILRGIFRRFKEVKLLEAKDGQEAIDICKSDTIDIVLMDIMMPNVDGFEATQTIKDLYPDTIVIAISALQDVDSEVKMLEHGASSYIKKPFDRKIVAYQISNFINLKKRSKKIIDKNKERSVVVNPFSKEIRSMHTIYSIINDETMMDFSLWLSEKYYSKNRTESERFHTTQQIIFKIYKERKKDKRDLRIYIEEGFDECFLNFMKDPEKDSYLDTREFGMIGDFFIEKQNYIHILLALSEEKPQNTTVENEDTKAKSQPTQKRSLENSEKEVLRRSYDEKISAKAFLEALDFSIKDELDELEELEEDFDIKLLAFEENFSKETFTELSELVERYAQVLNFLYEFKSVAYALTALTSFMVTIDDAILEENHKKIQIVLDAIRQDLVSWRQTIFVDAHTNDIHYLDASLFSSCLQLESILTNIEVEDDDDDIEFF